MIIDVYDLLELAKKVGYDCNVYIMPGVAPQTIVVKVSADVHGHELSMYNEFFCDELFSEEAFSEENKEDVRDHLDDLAERAKEYFEGFDR